MKKIWNIVSSILVGIVVLFAVFLMGSRLVGYQVFNVISGSMEPEYSVGDLIYVKKVNTKVAEIEIEVNPEDVNNIIGHKKENINKLKEVYDVDVIIKSDENIKNGKFEMKIEKTYDDILEEVRK